LRNARLPEGVAGLSGVFFAGGSQLSNHVGGFNKCRHIWLHHTFFAVTFAVLDRKRYGVSALKCFGYGISQNGFISR
jgi:hypothetical protein